MTQEQRITLLAQGIGADIKALLNNQGNLTSLTTTAKTSLVAAINELKAAINGASGINDSTTSTSSTWSSSKIETSMNAAVAALVNGSAAALDTLKELADALGNDPNFATTITTALGNRVRVDAVQSFTAPQQLQGCTNLGIGNPDADFVAAYNTAKQ